jgi:hypothetical protein
MTMTAIPMIVALSELSHRTPKTVSIYRSLSGVPGKLRQLVQFVSQHLRVHHP